MTVRELIADLEKCSHSLDVVVVVVETDSKADVRAWREIESVRVIKLEKTDFEIGIALSVARGEQ